MGTPTSRIWFVVHGWLSLPVWLLFCVICVTGTIAVISHELTWLTNPAARAFNPDDRPAHPIPELVAAVEAGIPGSQVTGVMVYEPYLVHVIRIAEDGKPPALVYVNPYSGEIQAVNYGLTFIGFMRTLHGWLFFPWQHSYSIGYYLVSAMAFVTLGAMITGMVVYKRFWRAYRQPMLRSGRGLRVLLGDLHRLFGAWSLWFLLVMGLTGAWYLTQAVLWHNEIDISEPFEALPVATVPLTDGTIPAKISVAEAYGNALRAVPSLQPAWVTMPEFNQGYYSIKGSGEAMFLFDQYAFSADVNPWTGDVTKITTPATMNGLEVLTHIADPLHYGTFGGLWTKVIWFLFGLALSAMSVTGFTIRTKRTIRSSQATHVPEQIVPAAVAEIQGEKA